MNHSMHKVKLVIPSLGTKSSFSYLTKSIAFVLFLLVSQKINSNNIPVSKKALFETFRSEDLNPHHLHFTHCHSHIANFHFE
ncbi:Uncharacterised protein [Candidatus Venteria ishoeyi]|uniref:Uncharacterized protein n=1 Tax=Candidatus Venteria ishoeyi TaxID=1899563 RepID=A0A1H6F912_9GAMM|nr:Uncharacterised protein [Candidatus Venteria ishoeyi]